MDPNKLPSGGKFTHGTSGSISIDKTNPNKPIMNVSGNGANSVIQWGGGFSIGNKAQVNFIGNDQNYLNIAHGTDKSTIEGVLNAGGNNVFLINPNGVIITKTGTINANRFVASTSSMDSKSMQEFADGKLAYNTFSPVFKPHKAGNVVNMGNINANDVLLIGNKVDIQGGKLGNEKSTTHLVGKNVYIDADSTNLNSTINVTATEGGYIQRQMINFAKDKYSFGDNVKINVVNYKDSSGTTHIGSSNFKKALTIGNMGNEKDNAIEWWHFAKGWNEDLGDIRNIDEFRLVGNIDFSGTTVDPIAYNYKNAFNKMLNGNGYTLKNITINANKDYDVGLFGVINEGEISNINIDTINFRYEKDLPSRIGGFAGYIKNGKISNISLSNIGAINGVRIVGGFSGNISDSYISNIMINQIESISALNEGQFAGNAVGVGGFTGMNASTTYDNIILNNIGDISLTNKTRDVYTSYIGWFIGRSDQLSQSENINTFNNIAIYNTGNISVDGAHGNSGLYIGSFAGALHGSKKDVIQNIYIFIDNNSEISYNKSFRSYYLGRFAGNLYDAKLNNIHIYSNNDTLYNMDNDFYLINDFNKNGYVSDKINIHTYNDNTQESAYKDFLSKANTIEKPSKPTDPTDPNDPDVILGSDDVISAKDLNQWLDEIFAGNYWVDIKDLDKIQGLSESIIQSISFLEALYGQEGMKEILKGISSEYENIIDKYNDKFENNKAELLAFINDKLKPLVDSSNKALARLKFIQEQLKTAIAKYNDYVKKVNENPAIKNEETLNALKAQVDKLNQISGELATTIAKNQITLKDWQDKASDDSNGQFTIKGQFDNVALLIPDLEKVTTNGNENDEYQKISRQIANLQKQTPTFEYEEEETEEVEEASLNQKNKACIVSDNFKTMNPCIVGGL
ncbi:filamentous hemagglutinin N-terminal domain-containing protein [Campylobacter lari]|nr:filamentous hemagglutinin N-terminal domain-containing protein [Campylobacter lari]